MKKKKRKKIRYCYEDYCKTVSDEERRLFDKKFKALIEIIYSSENDEEILARARDYDAGHNTDIFSEAINFTIYCLACHRVDCIC